MPTLLDQQLLNFQKKKSRDVIGLMSGMSMDGIDLAHVRFSGKNPQEIKLEIIGTQGFDYPPEFKKKLQQATNGSVRDVAFASDEIGTQFSKAVNLYLKKNKIKNYQIDAIGSHGQTLYAQFRPKTRMTVVGPGSSIAEKTGILTVFNMRQRDVALGGRGAPLSPLLDYFLFREAGKTISMNNLGSISNATIVEEDFSKIMGSDLGPANMAIDFFAKSIPEMNGIDLDGKFSAQGRINQELLDKWMSIDFFKRPLPKAAGYDEFGPRFLSQSLKEFNHIPPYDLLRTAVEFAAKTTCDAYKKWILPEYPKLSKITFTGGGSLNLTLINRIKELLPQIEIHSLGLSRPKLSDSKEAILFALIAHESIFGRPGNVIQATGAKKPSPLGEFAPGVSSWFEKNLST